MRISDWSSDVCSSDLPPLVGDIDTVEEQVHQHRLAAPDAAPEVNTPDRLGFAPGDARHETRPLCLRFQFGNRLAEAVRDRALWVVGAQLPGCTRVFITSDALALWQVRLAREQDVAKCGCPGAPGLGRQ